MTQKTDMRIANEITAKRLEILMELSRLCLRDVENNPHDKESAEVFESLYIDVENLCRKYKITK